MSHFARINVPGYNAQDIVAQIQTTLASFATVEAQQQTIALGFELMMRGLGLDIKAEGLKETPQRVAKMWLEVFNGLRQDPTEILSTTFTEDNHQELVIVRDIPFYSMCEHHFVPFFGKAHIGYIPNEGVVGISKLARLVDCFAKRPQIQERLTSQIADTLEGTLKPLGVGVVIEAEHMCMTMRGVQKPGSQTVTSAVRGIFIEQERARHELLSLIGRGR